MTLERPGMVGGLGIAGIEGGRGMVNPDAPVRPSDVNDALAPTEPII